MNAASRRLYTHTLPATLAVTAAIGVPMALIGAYAVGWEPAHNTGRWPSFAAYAGAGALLWPIPAGVARTPRNRDPIRGFLAIPGLFMVLYAAVIVVDMGAGIVAGINPFSTRAAFVGVLYSLAVTWWGLKVSEAGSE